MQHAAGIRTRGEGPSKCDEEDGGETMTESRRMTAILAAWIGKFFLYSFSYENEMSIVSLTM